MPAPETTPTDPRPDLAPTPSTGGITPNQQPAADPDPQASGNPETVTQADLASSNGAGIRGNYGDASQTNGLEGGQEPTDTELTGS